jgi:hypothetical protein
MGRKSREKQLRRGPERTGGESGRKSSGAGFGWILGTVLVLAAVIGGSIYFVQANKGRVLRTVLLSGVSVLETKLAAQAGKLSWDESQRLSRLLTDIRAIAGLPGLDDRAAGQLQFVLKVMEEIFREGNLSPGEIDKLETLALQVRAHLQKLQSQGRGPAKP